MPLVINEEQQMLRSSAAEFLQKKSPVEALRKLRDSRSETGYDPAIWQEMADMGWTALTIPEAYGGLDFGFTGFGQVLEETGRTLCASPLISTALIGSTAVQHLGTVVQKEALLPEIGAGNLLITLAIDEAGHHNPEHIETTAEAVGDDFILNGKKTFVLDGHVVNKLIVVAKSANGISTFLVDAGREGLTVERNIMIDSRNSATVTLENVRVPASDLLGEEGNAGAALTKVLDIARIGVAAEMLGTVREAFDRTVAYIKERKQFDRPIGSFQALQHRAAHMFCEIELCISVVLKGLQAIDEDSPLLPGLASLAKAKLGSVSQLVTNEAIQMYGGIGMTDDEEIGFFLKRARAANAFLGDHRYHGDRFAKLQGY
ncbi:MAG: acyl-CoA dehydrogenase [Bacteroidota bacterium]